MDTRTTPLVSPALEPEVMTALMLRYVEDNEEAAYQYARALVRRFIADLSTHDALRLARGIITGWDDAYEYAMAGTGIWPRLARLAMDAYLAHAILEVAIVPVDDEEVDTESRALLYRFTRPR